MSNKKAKAAADVTAPATTAPAVQAAPNTEVTAGAATDQAVAPTGDQSAPSTPPEPPADAKAKASGKVRIICTLPNASDNINGVAFIAGAGGMVSEEIPAAVAERFLSIPGYKKA